MKVAVLGEGITAKAVIKKGNTLQGFSITNVEDADIIVTSPSIGSNHFPRTSKEIISEVEFAYRLFHRKESIFRPKLIGVTGTNGKTTVTSLIANILDVPYAGNIGVPLINFVDEPQKKDWLVVELSSYQLEFCTTFRPEVAIIINITPDHMERHRTMEEYAKQKAKIFKNQLSEDILIYLEDEQWLKPYLPNTQAKKITFCETGQILKDFKGMKLVGMHNKLNAAASYFAAEFAGVDPEIILEKIRVFDPIEHRIEYILTHQGRSFYNDSKATNPNSTIVGVNAFEKKPHLIICGKDKGLELEDFLSFLQQKVQGIILFGEIRDRFLEVGKKVKLNLPLHIVNNIEEAVIKAGEITEAGDIILFSPACSSFDHFQNFEHRGKVFKELVKKHYG